MHFGAKLAFGGTRSETGVIPDGTVPSPLPKQYYSVLEDGVISVSNRFLGGLVTSIRQFSLFFIYAQT